MPKADPKNATGKVIPDDLLLGLVKLPMVAKLSRKRLTGSLTLRTNLHKL